MGMKTPFARARAHTHTRKSKKEYLHVINYLGILTFRIETNFFLLPFESCLHRSVCISHNVPTSPPTTLVSIQNATSNSFFYSKRTQTTSLYSLYQSCSPPLKFQKRGGKREKKKTSRDSAKVILHNNTPLIGVLDGSRIRHSFWQLR